MFDKAFVIFKQLFCTANTIENANSNRPLVFILLQISLALKIMQTERERHNDSVLMLHDSLATQEGGHECNVQDHHTYAIETAPGQTIPCTIGSSLCTWPLRDINTFCTKGAINSSQSTATKVIDIYFNAGETREMDLRFNEKTLHS
jgi:hypothetical protein